MQEPLRGNSVSGPLAFGFCLRGHPVPQRCGRRGPGKYTEGGPSSSGNASPCRKGPDSAKRHRLSPPRTLTSHDGSIGSWKKRRFATRSLQTVFSLALLRFLRVAGVAGGCQGRESFPPPKASDSPGPHLARVCSEPRSEGSSPELASPASRPSPLLLPSQSPLSDHTACFTHQGQDSAPQP